MVCRGRVCGREVWEREEVHWESEVEVGGECKKLRWRGDAWRRAGDLGKGEEGSR